MSRNKTNYIVMCVVLIIFSACSLFLSIWIGNSMGILFDSVLDKYLNYTSAMLYLAASAVNRIFFVIFLILFIISIVKLIKHKNHKKNILQILIIVLFVAVNIVFLVLSTSLQANESKAVDSIPVKSYVDIYEIFDIPADDASYTEQTIYGKVNSDIPVNYEVQQMTSLYTVNTSCIETIDGELLSKYYEEQKNKYGQYSVEDFSAEQLKDMSASKGCIVTESENSLIVLAIKSNKYYKIYISGDDIPEQNEIIRQICIL